MDKNSNNNYRKPKNSDGDFNKKKSDSPFGKYSRDNSRGRDNSEGSSFGGEKKFGGERSFDKGGDKPFRSRDDRGGAGFGKSREFGGEKKFGGERSFDKGGDKPFRSRDDRGGAGFGKSREFGGEKKFGGERSFDKGGDKPFRSRDDRGGAGFGKSREFGGEKKFGGERSFDKGGDKPFRSRDDRGGAGFGKSREFGGEKKFGGERSFDKGGDKPFRSRDDRGGAGFGKSREFGGEKKFGGERSFDKGGDKPFRSRDDRGGAGFGKSREFGGEKKFGGERSFDKGGDKPFRSRDDRGGAGFGKSREFGGEKKFGGERSFDKGGDKPFRSRDDKGGEKSFRGRSEDKQESRGSNLGRQRDMGGSTNTRGRGRTDEKPKSVLVNKFVKRGEVNEQENVPPSYDLRHYEKHHKNETENKEERGIRLNRFIANSGVCSRRDADKLIESGEITVNGKVITEMGHRVQFTDVIKHGNKQLKREKNVYVLLNKPKDFITTTDDPDERKTVMQLVANACDERIYPVGRLDRNTTGLLLLTNDGELADKLAHPSQKITKVYQVDLDKPITEEDYDKIVAGLTLEDGLAEVDELEILSPDRSILGIAIHIGRNRIVRRIFESLGYEVVRLDRVMYADLDKRNLPRGHWRYLNEKEVIRLKYFMK